MNIRLGSSWTASADVRPSRPPLTALCAVLAAVCAALVAAPAMALAADQPESVSWEAQVNGENVATTTADDPVTLVPGEPARVTVVVQNRGDQEFTATYVRLKGAVLGIDFYVFTTRVDLVVAPGAEERREFEIDLLDLGSQARGLIPSRILLLDADVDEIAGRSMQVDVRGEINSLYMVFGLVVGAAALVLLGVALWRLATGTMHPNRWRRGMTLAIPGLGLGFLLTFSLSALRVASPQAALWTGLVLGGAVLGFVAGYLSPNPDYGDVDGDGDGEVDPDSTRQYRLEDNEVAAAEDDATVLPGAREPADDSREPPLFRR